MLGGMKYWICVFLGRTARKGKALKGWLCLGQASISLADNGLHGADAL